MKSALSWIKKQKGFETGAPSGIESALKSALSWIKKQKRFETRAPSGIEDAEDFSAEFNDMEGLEFELKGFFGNFAIFTTSDSCPWPQIKLGRLTASYSGSPESISLIRQWAVDCSTQHSECSQPLTSLPTRVIDIGSSSDCIPKLCSRGGIVDRYCALSHRWGTSKLIQTTNATLADRESAIPWTQLPKTFQDAIELTRSLSIRYLWIDSLCIIQDDREDWQKESAQMATIYENAYLIIAATNASNCSAGCFQVRSTSVMTASLPFYKHITATMEIVPIYLRVPKDLHADYNPSSAMNAMPNTHLPLLSRAWVLQERLLATRVVHFAGEDLIWECQHGTSCECMELDSRNGMSSMKRQWKEQIQRRRETSFFLWHKLLRLHSSLGITCPSDRFPSLSGIVKRMQVAGAGDYIAGLWKENLFADLFWYPTTMKARPREWRAPSWSWACLDCRLRNVLEQDNSPDLVLDHINLRERQSSDVISALEPFQTTFVGEEVTLAGKDRTGEVASAYLILSAPVIKISIKPGSAKSWRIEKDRQSLGFTHDCDADFAKSSGKRRDFVCMWIGTVWKESEMFPQLLVLGESVGISGLPATPNAYERVGIMSTNKYGDTSNLVEILMGWFKDAKPASIKMV